VKPVVALNDAVLSTEYVVAVPLGVIVLLHSGPWLTQRDVPDSVPPDQNWRIDRSPSGSC
jgi:hypothetical protein